MAWAETGEERLPKHGQILATILILDSEEISPSIVQSASSKHQSARLAPRRFP
jgi:hypothetical protein